MNTPSIDEFARACEAFGPLRLVVEGPGRAGRSPRVYRLAAPFAVVGRDPGCDLVLEDPGVGPRPLYLQAFGPQMLCVHLGEAGDRDAPARAAKATWIDVRRGLHVGGLRLTMRGVRGAGPGGAGPGVEEPLLSTPLVRVEVEFRAGAASTRWRMRRAVALVGNAPDCTARLSCPSVARYHCALVRTGSGLWAVDLLGRIESSGRGGISVNGAPVRFARLGDGDVLSVGRFEARVRYLRRGAPAVDPAITQPDPSGPDALALRPTSLSGEEPLAALRREYERRLARLVEAHRGEVDGLRREVEDLREWVEEFRRLAETRKPRRRRLGTSRTPRLNAPLPTGTRTLGSATRAARAGFQNPALSGPPGAPVTPPAGLPGPPMADPSALDAPAGHPWTGLVESMLTAANAARPLS